MRHETSVRVEDLLEGLVQKIEKINREKIEDLEESRRALASMEKLWEAVRRLEHQKRREKIMVKRVADIHDRLERLSGSNRGTLEARSVIDAINSILNGAKTTGQVIEIVAGSLQAMIETVKAVLKSQQAGTRSQTPYGESRGADLSALLKPINTLLNSLITKTQARPQPPASPEVGREPEVVEGQHRKKDERDAVPVVKAVPVTENQPPEDQQSK